MKQLGRAVLSLREAQTQAIDEVRTAQTQLTDLVQSMRDEVTALSQRQTREMHALRQQVTEMKTRLEERRAADVSGDELTTALGKIQTDIARLRPETSEMATATQLADTINTLRDAGVDDLSAAHLVHALQQDMRNIRDDIQSVRGDVESLIGNRDGEIATPSHAV